MVIAGVAEGLTLPQVAERLHLRRGTVANYITSVLTKLGTPNRTAAVVLAVQQGWLCVESIRVIARADLSRPGG